MTARSAIKLIEPEARALQFGRTRDAHRVEIAEDYVELIAELIEANGEARAVELADRLGVTSATVNNTVARLQREGLVRSEPYRSIFLTEAGWDLAHFCRNRHRIVIDFLKALGVADEVAAIDAEGIEHHVSKETLDAFERFLTRRDAGADFSQR